MRRALIIGGIVAAIVVVVLLVGGTGSGNDYLVRAVFDNGSFVVSGEDVRVAGANVGSVQSVGVTLPDETASEQGGPHAVPGKAVVVLDVTDPGFQDFRRDASCIIRPQSLIGERYVDCRPTLPRAPGSPVPPPLAEVPSGQPGAGEHLLPLENNGKAVDVDLVNDVWRLPYTQRFRIILNELGAGLASRGKDLEDVIRRADPALRDTDRLLAILANQKDQLAQLAQDSETIMRPWARERAHVAGFFDSAGFSAQATAEKSPQLQASLQKFPIFLRQFRLTMRSLQGFSDQALPVTLALGKAAPSLTDATQHLPAFYSASTVSLRSLGQAGQASGQKFRDADPVVLQARALAQSGARPLTNFNRFLGTTQKTGGFENLMALIYNTTGQVNGFDKYGHFLRTMVTPSNCYDYIPNPAIPGAGTACASAKFQNVGTASSVPFAPTDTSTARLLRAQREREQLQQSGGTSAPGLLNYLLAP
jgi:ABC-type transporter Mla subunit MlaD